MHAPRPNGLQVCAQIVNLFAGVDLVWSWTLADDAQPPVRDTTIVAATQAGAYLLLHLSTGGAVLLGETEDGGGLEEVARSGAVLRPEGEVAELGACCLYEDASGWLRAHSSSDEGGAVRTAARLAPMCTGCRLLTAHASSKCILRHAIAHVQGESSRPAVYLLRCRHHSTLQLLEVPSFRLIATFSALEQGDAVVRDRIASGEAPGPPPRVPEAFQVAEIRMDSWPPLASAAHPLGPVPSPHALHARRPLLLVRTRDERLYVYRMQHCAAAAGASAEPELCLRRQPLDWTRCATTRTSIRLSK